MTSLFVQWLGSLVIGDVSCKYSPYPCSYLSVLLSVLLFLSWYVCLSCYSLSCSQSCHSLSCSHCPIASILLHYLPRLLSLLHHYPLSLLCYIFQLYNIYSVPCFNNIIYKHHSVKNMKLLLVPPQVQQYEAHQGFPAQREVRVFCALYLQVSNGARSPLL